MSAEQSLPAMNYNDILQLGHAYMRDALQSETQSDYIAAEGMYHICCDLFSGLLEQDILQDEEVKSEYMQALFSWAMLPQTGQDDKIQYLNQAYQLATELQHNSEDLEYVIAAEGIQEELEVLQKELEQEKEKEYEISL